MHNNYYLITQLQKAIHKKLIGARLVACFSQSKEELILQFITIDDHDFIIRAHLRSNFSSLSFPDSFARARKNSIDIFPNLIGQTVLSIQGYDNERAFSLHFDSEDTLLFKLYGNRANIIYSQHNLEIIELFKNKLVGDQNIKIAELPRPIVQNYDAYLEAEHWSELYPTFSREMKQELDHLLINQDKSSAWNTIKEYIQELQDKPVYNIYKNAQGKIQLTMRPVESPLLQTTDVIAALTEFYKLKIRTEALTQEKSRLQKELQSKLKKTGTYLEKIKSKKHQLEHDSSFQQMADILMANLHIESANQKTIELYDFYNDRPIKIKINPRLSLQKNAANYYRKGKNIKLEIENLTNNIAAKSTLLSHIKEELEAVEAIDDFRQIQQKGIPKSQKVKHDFKELTIDGYTILIGKNAKQNDLLTLKFAKPNDTWLHAKDVSGSHVVIKDRPGQNIPKKVLAEAASFAAFYSKRKTDSLCPVSYTKKKYVRKRKGMAVGAVIVERESVLLVEPKSPD